MAFVLISQLDILSSNSEAQLFSAARLLWFLEKLKGKLPEAGAVSPLAFASAATHSALCIAQAQHSLRDWIELLKAQLPCLGLPLRPQLTALRLTA